MRKLKIINIINTPNAIIQKFGIEVFDEIDAILSNGDKVELSFEGLSNLTTGFCNAAIGNVYQKYQSQATDLLFLVDLKNQDWKEKVEEAIELGLNPDKQNRLDAAIADLFD